MRRTFAAALLALWLGPVHGGAAADVQPYKTMRALQGLEDRIAAGDALAQAARAKAIARLAVGFAALPPETWRDLRNARALVAYLFSGGDAGVIAPAISPEAVHLEVTSLYRGALAYAAGDDETARALLQPIDARSLPAGLAGHLALVQAALVEPTDKAKALTLLDLARLVEPGTLVEEAALRKQMAMIGSAGDADKLILLERRYQAAFARSVYAEDFNRLVGDLALQVAGDNTPSANERLARLLSPLGPAPRRRLYLAVARREVVAGHLVSAPFAAVESLKLSDKGGRDEARAQLYYGASAFVGDGYDKALAALTAAAPHQLDERDQILRTAALDMAATLRAAASATPSPPEARSALDVKADEAMAAADTVLRSVTK